MSKRDGQAISKTAKEANEAGAKGKAGLEVSGFGAYLLTSVLWSAVIASATAVVYSTHLTRHAFYEYQRLEKQSNALQVEWGQLLLEKSTQAAQLRVERLAQNKLGMTTPSLAEVVVVKD